MKKKITDALVNLKDTIDQNISPRKQKIIEAALTIPMIAAATMSGVSAGGCPYGLTSCPYPGQCRRYIDSNGNGLCDLSLADANTQTSAPSTGSDSQTTHDTSTTPSDGSESSTSISGDDSSSISSGGVDIQNGSDDYSNASASTVQDPGSDVGGTKGNDFHIIPISLLIIGAYLFTHYLFSKGLLKPKTHKRLWNLLVLGGSLGTSITGVLLIFMVNLGIGLAYREGLAYWHVELAILMVICTLIHFHIYRKSFKNTFNVLFNFRSNTDKKKSDKTVGISK